MTGGCSLIRRWWLPDLVARRQRFSDPTAQWWWLPDLAMRWWRLLDPTTRRGQFFNSEARRHRLIDLEARQWRLPGGERGVHPQRRRPRDTLRSNVPRASSGDGLLRSGSNLMIFTIINITHLSYQQFSHWISFMKEMRFSIKVKDFTQIWGAQHCHVCIFFACTVKREIS
jgi:hypothetical protein